MDKVEALKETVRGAVDLVPGAFGLNCVDVDAAEKPKLIVYDEGDWENFWVPAEEGWIYIWCPAPSKPVNFGGGALNGRAGVAFLQGESMLGLGLKIWHEALHAVGPNSDMLGTDYPRFLGPPMKKIFKLDEWFERRIGRDLVKTSFWVQPHYLYLTKSALIDGELPTNFQVYIDL